MKVQLCAGRQRRPGWIRVDADRRTRPDIVATMPPLPPNIRDCEAIELIHGIEHFLLPHAIQLLREIHVALRDGGQLILELPNLRYACEVIAGSRKAPDQIKHGMWPLYGDPSHGELYGHKWGWTPETLRAQLEAIGFGDITEQRATTHVPGRDFRMIARKVLPSSPAAI